MKKFTLSSELWVPAPIEQVWEFSSQPKNLARISPPESKIEVYFDGQIKQGSLFAIKMRIVPTPLEARWLSKIQEITATGERRQFVDLQIEGPFRHWKHLHQFESAPHPSGSAILGTWIRDQVEYAMPLSKFGEWVHSIWLKKHLEYTFAYRRQELSTIFNK